MDTCSGTGKFSHDEVVYTCRECPVCAEHGNTEEAQQAEDRMADDLIKAETERDEIKAREQQLEDIIADCPGCSARKIAEKL